MVSKITLIALVAVTLMASTTVANTDFSPCVNSLAAVNAHLGLGIDLVNTLKVVISDVLTIVGGLLYAILGGGGQPTQVIAPPADLNAAIGFISKGLYVTDCGLRKQIGPQYKRNYLSQCYMYSIKQMCDKGLLNISVDSWLKLDADLNINVVVKELQDLLKTIDQDVLQTLIGAVDQLLGIVLYDVDQLFNSLSTFLSLSLQIVLGFSRQCGYDKVDQACQTYQTVYNPLLVSLNVGLDVGLLNTQNYCSKCLGK